MKHLTSFPARVVIFIYGLSFTHNVFAQSITSFSPSNGPVGTAVTIVGTGFNTTASSNTVFIGGTKATVSSATAVTLVVNVPGGAASNAPITVINTATHLQAVSKNAFRITYASAVGFVMSGTTYSTNINYTSVSNTNSGGTMRRVMAVTDFDLDGAPDIVTVGPSQVGILRNVATAGAALTASSFSAVYTLTTAGSSVDLYTGDLNGDGLIDIVAGNGSNISVFMNQSSPGTLSFLAKQDFTVTGPNVKIADMDGDGKLDIISSASSSASTAYILRNTTSSSSTTLTFAAAFSLTGFGAAMDFTIADMNLDGKQDIVSVNASSMNVFINTSTTGSLSFNAAVNVTGSISGSGYNVMSIAAGDLDNDGDLDLVVGNNNTTTSVIFTNTYATGTFLSTYLTASTITLGSPGQFSNIIDLQDLDGDGKADIIGENSNTSNIYILQNNYSSGLLSGSSFRSQITFSNASTFQSVLGVDLNGDKKPDLVTANYFSNTVSVFTNQSTLPVSLSVFTATRQTNTVQLEWTSENEYNAASYVLEKSADAVHWSTLGTIAAVGNSTQQTNYHYTDQQPSLQNYCRLKQFDVDGTFQYSKVITVAMGSYAADKISLYPNPANSYVTISLTSTTNQEIEMLLYNSSGILVKTLRKSITVGLNNLTVNGIDEWPGGQYHIVITGNTNMRVTNKHVSFLKQ